MSALDELGGCIAIFLTGAWLLLLLTFGLIGLVELGVSPLSPDSWCGDNLVCQERYQEPNYAWAATMLSIFVILLSIGVAFVVDVARTGPKK